MKAEDSKITVREVSVSTAYRNGYKLMPGTFVTKERAINVAKAAARRHRATAAAVCIVTEKTKRVYRIFLKLSRASFSRNYKVETKNRELKKVYMRTLKR